VHALAKRPLREIFLRSMQLPNRIVEIGYRKLWVEMCKRKYVNEYDGKTYISHGLTREGASHQVLDPLLIGFGRSRVPAVQGIELQDKFCHG
jgi:hypothetical protein